MDVANQTMCIYFVLIFTNIFSLAMLEQNVGVASFSRDYLRRYRRQGPIVQPDWVPNSDFNLFEDFNVRVTDRKLEETEAIRDYIQETVDNDTYQVELDENDFKEGELQTEEEVEETTPLDLSEPGPELKVDPRTMTVPEPQPEPEPEPEPIPVEPRPNEKPSNEPQNPREPEATIDEPRNSKIFSKTFRSRTEGGSRFFIWLRKAFTRS